MIHPLCSKCVHTCKQENTVRIIHCPEFQKRLNDNEFKNLIEELQHMELEAKNLEKRAQKLIRSAVSGSVQIEED
ncbi:MAG TPA: hypothetical protein VMZ04_04020 [Anaerolineae bacterium]|nr:hypothetical protein [Anaerolineae bacterium]